MKKVIITFCLIIFLVLFLLAQQSTQMQRGAALYVQFCLTCHQKNGSGVRSLNPTLVKAKTVLGDKKGLINWVLYGTNPEDKKEINGEFYSNNMPAQNYLTDQQIADVLTYVRNSFGNKASAVTAAEVKSVRAAAK